MVVVAYDYHCGLKQYGIVIIKDKESELLSIISIFPYLSDEKLFLKN